MSANFFESLEKRQLLSASLVNGLLTVTGTNLADVIAISQDSTRVRVNENGAVRAFTATAVKSIVVEGLAGNDQLLGRTNLRKPLTLRGGAGNDTLVGGARGDTFEGGPGQDRADYSHRRENLVISLDNVANDGAAGESDNVRSDVEMILSGRGSDLITGSEGNDLIYAGSGSDTVYGMGGHDLISVNSIANDEPDSVFGGDGNDWIVAKGPSRLRALGQGGSDKIEGGAGHDLLDGGSGSDTILGNDGNDSILGGDARDSLLGGNGNDTLQGGWGDDIIDAGAGNDTVWGNSAPRPLRRIGGVIVDIEVVRLVNTSDSDVIFGGAGDDQLHGNGDIDTLSGGDGNDKLWGDDGNDQLRGNNGNDSVYGGAGNDNMSGDAGNDLLVSIGGGHFDTLWGDTGSDQFWADAEGTEIIRDADLGEILFGAVKRVPRFNNLVSRELNGQNLPDPDPIDRRGTATTADDVTPVWTNFAANPFVSSRGIRETDVQQGQVGDCYFLASLAAMAKFSPIRLTNSMVDLGDGTYAVQFRRGDAVEFVRVDADLPVQFTGSTTPYYAGLGFENSIWVPIVEKAFTYFRRTAGTYQSISGGGSREGFNAFGLRDAGNLFVSGDGSQTLQNIKDAMASGKLVTLATKNEAPPAGIPAIQNHEYVVESVNTIKIWMPGAGGLLRGGRFVEMIFSVTLRNPWGVDGAGADGNVNDGLVTFTTSQIQRYFASATAAWA